LERDFFELLLLKQIRFHRIWLMMMSKKSSIEREGNQSGLQRSAAPKIGIHGEEPENSGPGHTKDKGAAGG
jgi:hypothetical protein